VIVPKPKFTFGIKITQNRRDKESKTGLSAKSSVAAGKNASFSITKIFSEEKPIDQEHFSAVSKKQCLLWSKLKNLKKNGPPLQTPTGAINIFLQLARSAAFFISRSLSGPESTVGLGGKDVWLDKYTFYR
jgi:hypothetical protein